MAILVDEKRLLKENKETRKKAILKLLKKRIDNYIPSISFLTPFQIDKFVESCLDSVKHKSYSITIKYADQDYLIPFIFLLTKKENKENEKAKRKRNEYTITFSGNRFKKTCKQTLDLNQKLSYIINYKLLSASKKHGLYHDLSALDHNLLSANKKIQEKTFNKMMEIQDKLDSNKKIPIPDDLSKIVNYLRVTPKTKVPIYYKNYSKIDNTPKKTTTKKINIYNDKTNLPEKPKLKADKNIIKKIRDEYEAQRETIKKLENAWKLNLQKSLKKENAKKSKKSKKLNLQERLEFFKKENAKKAKKLKNFKKQYQLDKIVKNTLKKYKEPKPKPKKSIWDVVKFPKPLVI